LKARAWCTQSKKRKKLCVKKFGKERKEKGKKRGKGKKKTVGLFTGTVAKGLRNYNI
jgi:hypothetical protein